MAEKDPKAIREEIAKLEKLAEDLERKQKEDAIKEVKALIKKQDITAEDLGFTQKNQRKPRGKRTPKTVYKKGSQTWSGRGRKPKWAQEIFDKEGEAGLERHRVS